VKKKKHEGRGENALSDAFVLCLPLGLAPSRSKADDDADP
jgi:hypothetical protein